MKNYILTFSLIILASCSYAQKTISVLSGTTWTFYDDFSPALRAAASGSIIYVPGGTFDLGSNGDTINKQLTIIGVGFSLDSSGATGITRFLGGLALDNGADYTTLEGISMDYVYSSTSSSYYNNILIKRCFVQSVSFNNYSSNYGKNYYISESVVCNLQGGSDPYNGITHYNYLKVEKCIISSYFTGCYGATFNNNVLHKLADGYINNNACDFNNNIFVDSLRDYEVATNSIFNNNIFRVSGTGWTGSLSNVYIGCTWNKLPISIFINPAISGTCDQIYNPQYNYHLKSTSPAKNFGTDGTDAGIYGTTSPCKDGWVPSNPHISTKTIGPSSLSNGTLPVNIKVVAQDR